MQKVELGRFAGIEIWKLYYLRLSQKRQYQSQKKVNIPQILKLPIFLDDDWTQNKGNYYCYRMNVVVHLDSLDLIR